MLARIPVILFGIPAVYGILVAAGDIPRMIFLIIIALLGQHELISMINKGNSYKPILEWLSGIGILVAAHFYSEKGILLSFCLATILLMYQTVLRGLKGDGYKRFTLGLFSLLYLPLCLSFFLLLGQQKGGLLLFLILGSVWALDIGAYLFGMSIGGPKLAPQISPKKTIAGAIGGAISSTGYLFVINHYQLISLETSKLLILGIAIAITGQIADLFESVLKREAEIKDSSNLLGAHGGILDRIDSVLFLGPLCYAFITLL